MKFFKIANIIEMFFVWLLLVLIIVTVNKDLFRSIDDMIGFSVCPLVVGIVSWNCITNIQLLATYQGNSSKRLNKALFWVLGILFILIWLSIMFAIIAAFSALNKYENDRNYTGTLFLIIWLFLACCNGIYIFIKQVSLFYKQKREINQHYDEIISSLGQFEE